MQRYCLIVTMLAVAMLTGCSQKTKVLVINGDSAASGIEGTISADGSTFKTCDGDEVDLAKVGSHSISDTGQPCPEPRFRHHLPPKYKKSLQR
jgi:hypothetical protein